MASVVVVTPNPAIDVTYRVERQAVGTAHRVQTSAKQAGGKGVNVARALVALGHDPICLLPLGGASGDRMRAGLEGLGLRVIATQISAETRSTVTVTDGASHPTLYSEPGPVMSAPEWNSLDSSIRNALPGSAMLIVSGSFPRDADADMLGGWIRHARETGVRTLVDATGPALIAAACAGADIVKCNIHELLDTTGAEDVKAGCRELRNLGARMVVVSLGPDGIVAGDSERQYEMAAVEGVSGNPTGAGDAATAGLSAALVEGQSVSEALVWAVALGASAVLRPVAGEVDIEAFRRFLVNSRLNGARG